MESIIFNLFRMITSQSIYKTEDGCVFNSLEKAEEYEIVMKEVNKFLLTIPNVDNLNFNNGEGYVQHTPDLYGKIETVLVKLSNDWFKFKEPHTNFNYVLGRYIDDNNMRCLNSLSYRLMCIDKNTHREYGQPYFAAHPEKAQQIELKV